MRELSLLLERWHSRVRILAGSSTSIRTYLLTRRSKCPYTRLKGSTLQSWPAVHTFFRHHNNPALRISLKSSLMRCLFFGPFLDSQLAAGAASLSGTQVRGGWWAGTSTDKDTSDDLSLRNGLRASLAAPATSPLNTLRHLQLKDAGAFFQATVEITLIFTSRRRISFAHYPNFLVYYYYPVCQSQSVAPRAIFSAPKSAHVEACNSAWLHSTSSRRVISLSGQSIRFSI